MVSIEVLPLASPMFVAAVRLIPAGLIITVGDDEIEVSEECKGWLAVSLFVIDGAIFQDF